ncbi:MAG: PH domain-containing protein [Kiritimatiellae bacterium]|nr:PH domain-containing protein [Kiritimatiellia bacterium]
MKAIKNHEIIIIRHPTIRTVLPRMFLPISLLVSSYWGGWIVATVAVFWITCSVIRSTIDVISETYILTKTRVISNVGILRKTISAVHLSDIRAVFVKQSLVGRLFGYATIDIGTAAMGDLEITLRNVTDANSITQTIERLRTDLI